MEPAPANSKGQRESLIFNKSLSTKEEGQTCERFQRKYFRCSHGSAPVVAILCGAFPRSYLGFFFGGVNSNPLRKAHEHVTVTTQNTHPTDQYKRKISHTTPPDYSKLTLTKGKERENWTIKKAPNVETIEKPTAVKNATKPLHLKAIHPSLKPHPQFNLRKVQPKRKSVGNFSTIPLSGRVFTWENSRKDPLIAAPDLELVQITEFSSFPRVGDGGRHPYQVYAKPFDHTDKKPRIGIVVTGLGLSDAATVSAIQGLPGSVTLAFAPYSPRISEWIHLARAAGHEVLVNVPMEPLNYPTFNPGPQTLLTTIGAKANLDRLLWNLGRSSGYVGVLDFYGSRFTGSKKHMRPILAEIKKRGLLYLDSGSSPKPVAAHLARQLRLPLAESTLTLDEHASRRDIDKKFSQLDERAAKVGTAIGIASPYPVSLERISVWVRLLRARGYAIVPISAIAQLVSRETQR